MSEPKPLARLRRIRDAQKRAGELAVGRDDAIREALAEEHSERKVAEAAGLSPAHIHRIRNGKRTGRS